MHNKLDRMAPLITKEKKRGREKGPTLREKQNYYTNLRKNHRKKIPFQPIFLAVFSPNKSLNPK
jgi:hypothetical protein